MADLTVLVSPMPLYPLTTGFTFGRTPRPQTRPVMVTLDSSEAPQESQSDDEPLPQPQTPRPHPSDPLSTPASSPRRTRSRSPRPAIDSTFLSPPINTWKAPPQERARPRHRPTRSRSAPPERRYVRQDLEEGEGEQVGRRDTFYLPPVTPSSQEAQAGMVPFPRKSFTPGGGPGHTKGGELLPPPPPLLRPTTFWRKTRRSGVSGASYSPSSHLIRRSTYIAAGLAFDAPVHDLSALCVESRVGFIVVPPDEKF